MALLFAMFTLFLPYPVLWLWSVVAPSEVVDVQIDERIVHINPSPGRRAGQRSESCGLVRRTEQGETKRMDVDLALYQRATGTFDTLSTLALEQTRMLELPLRCALALNGLMLSLIMRPMRVPLDRRIVWSGGIAGFVAGMIWMLT